MKSFDTGTTVTTFDTDIIMNDDGGGGWIYKGVCACRTYSLCDSSYLAIEV